MLSAFKKILILIRNAAVLLSLIILFACAKREIDDKTIVARVGDTKITARDFRISYELAPVTPKKTYNNNVDKKSAHLQSLIEKKLLTIAGLEDSLDKEEDVQRLLRWYEKEAVIRELYRQQISNRVEVTEDEVREGYLLLNERLLLRQILLPSESEAEELYRRSQNGETFEQLATDLADSEAELNRLLTAREFTWGELDANLETAVFGLNHNELSAPIKTRSGYHLVQLVDRKHNLILTEYGYQERQHYVETIIRRRKEAKLAREYAVSIMEKLYPRAVGPVLLELTKTAQEAVRIENPEYPIPPYLQVKKVGPYIGDLLDEELVLFNGGSWTVGEFLAHVEQAHPKSRPDLTNPGTLQINLALMVRDEFLAQEGYERHLEKSRAVQDEVERLKEEIVAMRMRNRLIDTVQVSKIEINDFFFQNIDRYQKPEMVNIREIMVRDHKLADSLWTAIQNGENMSTLVRQFSVRKWAAKKGGELGYFARGAFGEVGKTAFDMQVGELTGPVPVKMDSFIVGYSVFKVIGRRPHETPMLQNIYESVAKDALEQKKQKVLKSFLDGVKEKHPVSLDESVLSSIRTSDELGTGRPMDIIKVVRR